MRFAQLTLAALFVLGASAVQAQTVVTFDDLSGSGTVADGYGGITWGGNWNYYDAPQFPYTAHSDPERVYTFSSTGPFSLNTPDVFDGAWFAGTSSTTVQFNLYDASNNLLASSSVLTTSDTPTFLASGYAGNDVKTINVLTNAPDFYVMDDVTYGTAMVTPEPGSVALLVGMGLSGAGFLARRCKNARKVA